LKVEPLFRRMTGGSLLQWAMVDGSPPPDSHWTESEEVSCPTLGSYRLLNLLGEGGMGRVYLAKHLVSGGLFAVKVLRPELTLDRSAVRRFISEARTVSSLGHPNIVRVIDVAEPPAGGGGGAQLEE
jgi:serine/threonine protein kinase